jgi:Cu+-exporting ATPase
MDQLVRPVQFFDLAIAGMSCASCVARVERSLGQVAGVQRVAVNLATETAHIEADCGTNVQALIESVGRAGYTAVTRCEKAPAQPWREPIELAIAAAFSLPLLLAMLWPLPGWVEFLLATPVQFWLGARFYVAGFRALRAGAGNMDLLVALGTSAAYFLSVADLWRMAGPLYFEASAVVITLVRLGKYLEGRLKREAVKSISGLARLRPALAHRSGVDVPVAQIAVGDVLEIRPGERVPVDGVILSGSGFVDESLITGESLPVLRQTGAKLLAGALNLQSALQIRSVAAAGESFLDRMARLIDTAQSSKPQIQLLADRVSAVFVPVVIGIALLTFGGWLLAGAALGPAMINAISVLVIACPCALGLATPAAILAGSAAAAKHGILLRNADALQHGARVDFVAFDKTGTLTQGKPRLVQVQTLAELAEATVLAYAAALAAGDNHPFSLALRIAGAEPAARLRSLAGRGVEGSIDGTRYILGSAGLIADAGGVVPQLHLPPQASVSYLALADGTLLAAFAFADTLRSDATQAIAKLRAMGLKVMLLSGDGQAPANATAQQLGISEVLARASPAEKLALIEARRAAGFTVAMVGDGINDAAALAAADVGIAVGNAADLAVETADFSLLRPEIMLVADALELSRRCWAVLKQGLFWAMAYNVIGIALAALGVLSPMIAGAAMAASSVSVLGNALRLRNWQPRSGQPGAGQPA